MVTWDDDTTYKTNKPAKVTIIDKGQKDGTKLGRPAGPVDVIEEETTRG